MPQLVSESHIALESATAIQTDLIEKKGVSMVLSTMTARDFQYSPSGR